MRNASVTLLPAENSEQRSLLENLHHPLEEAVAGEGKRLGEQKAGERASSTKFAHISPNCIVNSVSTTVTESRMALVVLLRF